MFRKAWTLIRDAALDFVEDNALSRGAAIAYYTTFSLGPVLVIVIAVAGLVFGEDAARGAIVHQLSGLMGHDAASMLQTAIQGAKRHGSSVLATAIGIGTLVITASGVFGEMQSALNAIWKASPPRSAVGQLVRARLVSLGLVMVLGFLLMVSLVISAGLTAVGDWLNGRFPGATVLLRVISIAISFALIAVLFAAIYKVLPDKNIAWRDVAAGAIASAVLFEIGKYLISLYIGSSSVASSYGAAGALAVILLWIYYSAQLFLFGAEFTRVYAERHGSKAPAPATVDQLG
jgi:membrane protein